MFKNKISFNSKVLQTLILGADAHQPERFLNFEAENKAHMLIKEYGLKLVETVPFRRF